MSATMTKPQTPLALGSIVATRTVYLMMNDGAGQCLAPFIKSCITRHHEGDWGKLCDEDTEANNIASHDGEDQGRILSSYDIPAELVAKCRAGEVALPDVKIWIITEWDRSVTTILFPSDY